MNAQQTYEPIPRFRLRYSRIALGIEIILHGLVLIAITQLVSGWWLAIFALLFVLLTIRYFKKESVICKFPPGSAIELREKPPSLIWFDDSYSNSFAPKDMDLYITRWFVLLSLGRGCACRRKLLLADSFDDKNLYTRFRRKLFEIAVC